MGAARAARAVARLPSASVQIQIQMQVPHSTARYSVRYQRSIDPRRPSSHLGPATRGGVSLGPCEPVSLRACVRHVPDLDEGPTLLTLQQSHPASGSVASRSMYSVRRPHNLMSRGPAKRANRRRRGWSRSRCRTGRTTRGPDGTVAALAARARGDFCPRCRL